MWVTSDLVCILVTCNSDVLLCCSIVPLRHLQSSFNEKEYAFEMASSSIRFGDGVTKEVGMDVANLGIKKLVVFTDKNVCMYVCMYGLGRILLL